MTIGDAILLGIVQGLTEFLPISSSGHLILAREFFGIAPEGGLLFDAFLHFATACAVAGYFWKDMMRLVRSGLTAVGLTNNENSSYVHHVFIATIPAVVLGYFLEAYMETVFRSASLVALTLGVGAGIMAGAEWFYSRRETKALSASRSFAIGAFQSLALVPGMSRSGMAIAGGMVMGLERAAATRFAFVLSAPLLLGAGLKKISDVFVFGTVSIELSVVLVGAIAASITGIAAMHGMLLYLRTNTLWPFIWYRIALAVIILTVLV